MPLPSTPSVPIMCQESFCLGMLACAVTKETGTAAGQQQACRQAGRELDSLRSPVSSAGTGAGPGWVLLCSLGQLELRPWEHEGFGDCLWECSKRHEAPARGNTSIH